MQKSSPVDYMSRIRRKPAFYICKNKSADQLHSNHAADLRLCFGYIDGKILFFLNPKFQASRHLLWYSLELDGDQEDRFSCDTANMCIFLCTYRSAATPPRRCLSTSTSCICMTLLVITLFPCPPPRVQLMAAETVTILKTWSTSLLCQVYIFYQCHLLITLVNSLDTDQA